jgi:hypothetical protein
MFLSERQEKDIKNLLCPYCHSGMTSNESHPDYYKCPKYCIRVWFSFQDSATWAGIRIYGGHTVGLRYYNGNPKMEIFDGVHLSEIDVFNVSDYSLQELGHILESYLISEFTIENKKV